MSEKVQAYFKKLQQMSNRELDGSAKSMALKEKQHTAWLIAHLAEISARKYHLTLGYKSLFEYCCQRLHLSEGSVALRIQVAGVCNRFPQILVALARGRLHLTSAGLIAPHLTDDNVTDLIRDVAGKSKREVKEYLVCFAPKEVFKPSIRKLPARPPKDAESQATQAPVAVPANPVLPQMPAKGKTQPSILEPATGEHYNFRFAADKAFADKFKRLGQILGIESDEKHMAVILEKAVDFTLDKKDPQRKNAQRKKHATKPRPDKVKEKTPATPRKPNRHIETAVRGRVFERAGYRCEYRGPDGRRCSARTRLEIEHTRPFAVYQSHEEAHLKLLCRAHNQLEAERYFGPAFIKHKIEIRRQRQDGLPSKQASRYG